MTLNGHAAYRALGTAMRVTQVMRQAGEDIETSTFRTVLDELRARSGCPSANETATDCLLKRLPPSIMRLMHLYFKNEEIREYHTITAS
ncbi:hypothetical protein V8E54_013856 [Elaphomyces granulatus]